MEQATLRYAEELQQKKNHFFWPSLWKKAYFWLLIYYKGEVNHSGLQVTNYRPIFSQKIELDKVGIVISQDIHYKHHHRELLMDLHWFVPVVLSIR